MNTLGEHLKERGIGIVLMASEPWSIKAARALRDFSRSTAGSFTSDDFRQHCAENGIPNPRHENAWGGIFNRCAKKGDIRRIGYVKSTRGPAHARPVTEWAANCPPVTVNVEAPLP
jgi:hypothetical protein